MGQDSGSSLVGSTSTGLLDGLRSNDPAAWRRMVRLYGPVIYRWCRLAGLGDEDAADVGQEVLLAIARAIHRFRRDRNGDSFRGWLWTITRNEVRQFFRRHKDVPGAPGGSEAQARLAQLPEEPPGTTSSSAGPADAGRLLARVIELVRGEFSEQAWQSFWRTAALGQSPAEVAAALGTTPGAVRKAKSRILLRIREILGEM